MSDCMDSASQWMGQCIADCPTQGTDTQYNYYYLVCNNGVCDLIEEYYFAPESGYNCYDQCDDEMNSRVEGCLSSNCTAE